MSSRCVSDGGNPLHLGIREVGNCRGNDEMHSAGAGGEWNCCAWVLGCLDVWMYGLGGGGGVEQVQRLRSGTYSREVH